MSHAWQVANSFTTNLQIYNSISISWCWSVTLRNHDSHRDVSFRGLLEILIVTRRINGSNRAHSFNGSVFSFLSFFFIERLASNSYVLGFIYLSCMRGRRFSLYIISFKKNNQRFILVQFLKLTFNSSPNFLILSLLSTQPSINLLVPSIASNAFFNFLSIWCSSNNGIMLSFMWWSIDVLASQSSASHFSLVNKCVSQLQYQVYHTQHSLVCFYYYIFLQRT